MTPQKRAVLTADSPRGTRTYFDMKMQRKLVWLFLQLPSLHVALLGSGEVLLGDFAPSENVWNPHWHSSQHFQTGHLLWAHCPQYSNFWKEERLPSALPTRSGQVKDANCHNRPKTRGVSSQDFQRLPKYSATGNRVHTGSLLARRSLTI